MALAVAEPSDSGSIDLASSSVDDAGSLITVQPRKTWSTSWWWYYAIISGASGRTPTIDVLSVDRFNATISTVTRLGCWAYDVAGPWYDFSSVSLLSSPERVRLAHSSAWTQDTVHLAYYPVYTQAMCAADLAAWAASPHVSATASSAASGDLSFYGLTARSNGAAGGGRTCPATKIYGFKATSGNLPIKNRAVISSGLHPNENAGAHAFRAFLTLLLSDDAKAAYLRERWEFYVYPCLNPQGVYGGLFRSFPDALASDANRIWNTTGTSGSVDAIKSAIVADTGGTVDVAFDLHCYPHDYGQGTNYHNLALIADTDTPGASWLPLVTSYDGRIKYRTNSGLSGLYTYWARDTLSPSIVYAAESGSASSLDLAGYQRHGRHLLYALADATERNQFTVGGLNTTGRVYFA